MLRMVRLNVIFAVLPVGQAVTPADLQTVTINVDEEHVDLSGLTVQLSEAIRDAAAGA